MDPKELILDIKNQILSSNREIVLDSLAGAIDRLQKVFPRYNSCLMEFIQNADDAQSSRLFFDIRRNRMFILNNGKEFTNEDVVSICKVGRSIKSAKDYIGYLGVGFKSAFMISDCVKIRSGDFNFKFDKYEWSEPSKYPWQIIPVLDYSLTEYDIGDYSTIFCLIFKEQSVVNTINEEVKSENLSNRILLFLRNINEIRIDLNGELIRIIQKKLIYQSPEYEVYEIIENENYSKITKDKWLTFRADCLVPEDVKEDFITKEWDRNQVDKREVIVAFRLNDEDEIVLEKGATAHAGVFSFLPMKEVPSGLNFLIQADFLTTPGRNDFARDCKWNKWMAEAVYNLIINKCIPSFKKHNKWKFNFTQVLYSREGGHPLFQNYIKNPLYKYLLEYQVLLDKDEIFCKSENLVRIHPNIMELISDEDLNFLFPGKKVIHPDCKFPDLFNIKILPEELYDFMNTTEFKSIISRNVNNLNWMLSFYSKLVNTYNFSYFKNKYPGARTKHYNAFKEFWYYKIYKSNLEIVLTDNLKLSNFNELYVNTDDLEIPKLVEGEIKVVHPEVAKSKEFNNLIRTIKGTLNYQDSVIKVLAENTIYEILKKLKVNELTSEKWNNLSDSEKMEEIKIFKNLWEKNYLNIDKIKFITVKTKSNKWLTPDKLIFPTEYQPDHNIPILIDKNLIDIKFEFLSCDFIENITTTELTKWRDFFKNLGVDSIIKTEKSKIVERIAILVSLKYEKEAGRNARELGESEKAGYDIVSKTQNETRFIEVKGRREQHPEIELTINELKALRENKGNYYLYVVTNALNFPVLQIIQGDKLFEIKDTKIIYTFDKWSTIIESKYNP